MKTWFGKATFCKATLAAAVACLTFVAASPAQAAACSNASLKGKYGQTISGEILPGGGAVLPRNGVAMTNFDGNGKFTQVDFVVINGTPTSKNFQTGETGTYKVNADRTGTGRINYSIEVPAGRDAAASIPVAVFRGAKPGPVLALVSGSHGTEYASIIALEKLIQSLDPAQISGTVIILPLVNIPSFEQKVPHVNTSKASPIASLFAPVMRKFCNSQAYDKSLHPGLLHGWNGGAGVGFSLTRGNSETTNLALAINAAHPTLNDKITIYTTSIDTTNGLVSPSTVARLVTAGIRYDRNIDARLFGFVGADFMSNALQDLDLRGVYGGGLGYHAIKSDKTTLDVLAGLNYTHETYSNGPLVTPVTVPPTYTSYGVTNRYAALTLGEELTQKAGKSTVSTENFYFFPDLTDSYTGQYRGTTAKPGYACCASWPEVISPWAKIFLV